MDAGHSDFDLVYDRLMSRKRIYSARPDTDTELAKSKRLDIYHPDQLEHLESIKNRTKLPPDFSITKRKEIKK